MANDTYWASTKWEYDANDDPTYLGMHKELNASEADAGWYIRRYIVDGSGNVTVLGPVLGAWSKRAQLL